MAPVVSDEPFEWGGGDMESRQARLDEAFAEYERRHRGEQRPRLAPAATPLDVEPPDWHEDDFEPGGPAWRQMQLLDIEIFHRAMPS